MVGQRFTRFAFFLLESCRFVAITVLLSALSTRGNWSGAVGAALAAPQALFVLAALLVWFDPERYAAFRPLYAAGKAISTFALGAGIGVALPSLGESLAIAEPAAFLTLSVALPVLAFDFTTASILTFSCLKEFLESRGSETELDRPPLVVDEIPEDKGEA